MLPAIRPGLDSNVRLVFPCPACGKILTATLPQSGTTGPCPQCGHPVTAPPPRFAAGLEASEAVPAAAPPAERAPSPQRVRRGRINADSALDHGHLAQRETARTLWIVTAFILAFCAVVAATWFMRQWGAR